MSRSFPPIWRRDARILILGSLPGVESLRTGRYYAHPRNVFWRILGELCGAGLDVPYARRIDILRDRGIALWDVIGEARRPGSLDASIDPSTLVVNDIPGLLRRCPRIGLVAFNGGATETLFRRHVRPSCRDLLPRLHLVRLPSTSPAHAARSFDEKLRLWREELKGIGDRSQETGDRRQESGDRSQEVARSGLELEA